jgi:hypothetical protein
MYNEMYAMLEIYDRRKRVCGFVCDYVEACGQHVDSI